MAVRLCGCTFMEDTEMPCPFLRGALGASALIALTSLAAQSLPTVMPSIPGLESSINRRIDTGLMRGFISPVQANNLRARLARIEQREQFLINTGRFNGFERARIAQELENLNASLRFDTGFGRIRRF